MHHKPPNAHQRALRFRSSVCHITGLPYTAAPPKNSGDYPWTTTYGMVNWNTDSVELVSYVANKPSQRPTILSPVFSIPSDINITMSSKLSRNSAASIGSTNWIVGYSIREANGLETGGMRITDTILDTGVAKNQTYEGSVEGTFTTSRNKLYAQYSYVAGSVKTYIHYFNIYYR